MARSTQDGGADLTISGCHVTQQSFHLVGTGHLLEHDLCHLCVPFVKDAEPVWLSKELLVSSFGFKKYCF
jgi:hypothetical protein